MRVAELYEFHYLGTTYLFTSHDVTVRYRDTDYTPSNLQRGSIKESQDKDKSQVKLTAALDFEIADLYRTGANVQNVALKIIRIDLDEAVDPAYTGIAIFNGSIVTVKWNNTNIEIKLKPLIISLESDVLRYQYSKVCNHTQYGPQCGLDITKIGRTTTISAIEDAGYTIIINPLSDTQFVNNTGSLCLVNKERGTISEQSSGNTIKLFRPIPGAAPGDTIHIGPSCQQHWRLCRDFFNNLGNCMAFVDVPQINPFGAEGIK